MRLFFPALLASLTIASILTGGCAQKKADATPQQAKKTFIGATSVKEVHEKYRSMIKP